MVVVFSALVTIHAGVTCPHPSGNFFNVDLFRVDAGGNVICRVMHVSSGGYVQLGFQVSV